MINIFYIVPGVTPRSEQLLLTLPGNLGLVSAQVMPKNCTELLQVFGACLLICFGGVFKHWKWTLGEFDHFAPSHAEL